MKEFVPFGLAKKLKEKGFREPCVATYDIDDYDEVDYNRYVLRSAYQMNVNAKDCLQIYNDEKGTLVDAPTISQVLKWLRDEKKIFIDVAIFADHRAGGYFWGCEVYDISQMPKHVYYKSSILNKSDYNEAALAGIEYVLDNLI